MKRKITLIAQTTDNPQAAVAGVRPAQEQDIQALARLLFNSYDNERVSSQAAALKEIQDLFAGARGDFYPAASPLLVDKNGRVISAVLTLKNRADGHKPQNLPAIFEVLTAASRRREGLAVNLLRQSLEAMKADGHQQVTVRIPEDNPAALALCLNLEFRRWQAEEDLF